MRLLCFDYGTLCLERRKQASLSGKASFPMQNRGITTFTSIPWKFFCAWRMDWRLANSNHGVSLALPFLASHPQCIWSQRQTNARKQLFSRARMDAWPHCLAALIGVSLFTGFIMREKHCWTCHGLGFADTSHHSRLWVPKRDERSSNYRETIRICRWLATVSFSSLCA